MRKRDALRMALRLPKLRESDKLLYTGLTILFISAILASDLVISTGNLIWIFILIVGFLIFVWFGKASEIMRDWEWKSLFKEDEGR